MQRKIFWSIFNTALAAMLTVGACVLFAIYGVFDSRMSEELKAQADYIARALPAVRAPLNYLESLSSDTRVTLIAAGGQVLYDNSAEPAAMENHLRRPEIVQAAAEGSGESRRYSDTLTQKTLYYALRLSDGSLLRLAATQRSLLGLVHRVLAPLFLAIAGVALLSLLLSKILARRVTEPIGKLNLSEPLDNDAYDELSPLLLRLEKQNDELREQLSALDRQRRELTAITDSMREGLLLIDASGGVLSVNRSAARIFETDAQACIGHSVLILSRRAELQQVIASAQQGNSSEALLSLKGRLYQILGSPVTDRGAVRGAVVLLLDVTEKQEAENSRREFTANVSHELRTPLTSIAGFSEIMQNGLAKPEDMRSFAGRIHDEALRMISLIEDILQLSQLDEGSRLPAREPVDLLQACENVAARLQPNAEAKKVTISVAGDHAVVQAIPKLLDEMIYNLADNAVKYNVPGGTVDLTVAQHGTGAAVSVKDSGIGIPPEHQSRVFERFYRVDKSHSRETGGTGLGLSIVKHAAALQGASVALDSEVGKGSRFTVVFRP